MTTVPSVPTSQGPQRLDRKQCEYTACFCEENVFLLANSLNDSSVNLARLFAVFLSNPAKQVPLWRQRSGGGGHGLVVWDYHVLLLQQGAGGSSSLVWDLDSTLPFPCPFQQYVNEALGHPGCLQLPEQLSRLYRLVPADIFLRHFASDRSHMRDGEGRWHQPPPPYPCIVAPGGARNTLPRYCEMGSLHEACASAGEAAEALQGANCGGCRGGCSAGPSRAAGQAAEAAAPQGGQYSSPGRPSQAVHLPSDGTASKDDCRRPTTTITTSCSSEPAGSPLAADRGGRGGPAQHRFGVVLTEPAFLAYFGGG